MEIDNHRIFEANAGKHGRRYHCLKCGAEFRSRQDASSHEANAGWEGGENARKESHTRRSLNP